MTKVNKHWNSYKKKISKEWHFNTFSNKKDVQYIGNLKTGCFQGKKNPWVETTIYF